jgi:hypothetical protein
MVDSPTSRRRGWRPDGRCAYTLVDRPHETDPAVLELVDEMERTGLQVGGRSRLRSSFPSAKVLRCRHPHRVH